MLNSFNIGNSMGKKSVTNLVQDLNMHGRCELYKLGNGFSSLGKLLILQ